MVTVNKASIAANVWETIYDRMLSDVTSVTITGSVTKTIQTYASSFQDKQIDNKASYPILVIEPVNLDWTPHTLTKKYSNGQFILNIYTTSSEAADKFIDAMVDSIETYRDTLLGLGLEFVDLVGTDSDNVQRGGFKLHMRSCTFSFRYAFTKTNP